MLFFIGLGVEQSPTIKAIGTLLECDRIFFETYTSPLLDQNVISELSSSLKGKKVEIVEREFVEDGRKIIQFAKEGNAALVCSGDPMIATTHQELRSRAMREKVKTRIMHGSSIITSIVGELGLHSYNFGRIVTMTREPMQYTAYNTIYQNLLKGLHTAILLEWDEANSFFLSPNDAILSLFEAERDLAYGIISDQTLILSVSRIGVEERVQSLTLETGRKFDFGKPPHVLVIPGRLHFTEREALSAVTETAPDFFIDNSAKVLRTADRMVSKYSTKTLTALERARYAAKRKEGTSNLVPVFENVELYVQDALRFLKEGKEELAVLSIGYAEGLLDSLRFSGTLEFEW